jgi:hypothetical protein
VEISVTGAEEFGALARRLRQAGRSDLRLELTRAVREAGKPVKDAAKVNVLALPAHGPKHTGLRGRVARTVKLSVRTSGGGVGVRVSAGPAGTDVGRLARHMNVGRWRHPVYGNRNAWVTQTMPPGWFDRATEHAAPKARQEIQDAMRRVREQIEG